MSNIPKKPQGFFNNLWRFFTLRKIQVDIVSVFIILIISFGAFLISFTHIKTSDSISKIATLTMQKASDDLLEKIHSMTTNTAFLAQASQALVATPSNLSYANKDLVTFILNILRYNPLISAIRVANNEGNLLAAANISFDKGLTHLYNNPSKPLPKGVAYIFRYANHLDGVATEVWQYLDKDLQILDQEVISPTLYDVRNEPWYIDTLNMKKLHWSNTYLNLLAQPGLVVTAPILDASGATEGVFALNLSLSLLSDFLTHQRVGASGESFILDAKGEILLPSIKTLLYSHHAPLLEKTPAILDQFLKSKKHSFIFKNNQTQYLVFIAQFPLHLEKTWYLLFIIPFDNFFHSFIETQKQVILFSILATIIFGIFIYFSSKHIAIPISKLAHQVREIQRFNFEGTFTFKSQILEILELEHAIHSMRTALHSFERYVPKQIVQVLIEQGKDLVVGGEKKEVTIFFSDIADFTTFAEITPVEKLLEDLTNYFEVFSKIILGFEGTIDKYIGDCVMAIWNAPQMVINHQDKACLSALHCLIASKKQQQQPGNPGWTTRFGLHTGEVVAGNIGTKERMNYTVIGDDVNLTSRLLGVNKVFDTSILISEVLQKKIDTLFLTRPLDTVSVKGKKKQTTVYELMGLLKGASEYLATEKQIELCHTFTIAYKHFQEGQMEEAKEYFLTLSKQFPEDKPTRIYLERLGVISSIF
jgi:adenylate cyclase